LPGDGGQDGLFFSDVLVAVSMVVVIASWWHWIPALNIGVGPFSHQSRSSAKPITTLP
jgi:hypothetical protein